MRIDNIVRMRLRALFRRNRVEEDLDEELRYHVERDTEENIRAGMTPDLARVLKHELTHSFVRQITLGHCPIWFNEGVAQLEDGSTTAALGSQLARALTAGKIPAYSSLEGSFVGLPADQAILVYASRQGTTVDRAVSDALVDIRHLCDIWRLDFGALDDDAYEGYLEELEYSKESDG